MLLINAFCVEEGILQRVMECTKTIESQSSEESNTKFRLEYATDVYQDMLRVAPKLESMSVILIGMKGVSAKDIDRAAAISAACSKSNRDHYIVYVLPSASILVDMMPYMFNVSGILLPPFDDAQLLRCLEKIAADYRLLGVKDGQAPSAFVALKYLGSLIRLRPGEIQYIEARDKKLQIHRQESEISIYDKMDDMKKRLGNQFFHCHRSYLVNCDAIYRIDLPRMEIELFDGTVLPISRTYRTQAAELLQQMEKAAAGV